MTKVEELREVVLSEVMGNISEYGGREEDGPEEVDALISAVRDEERIGKLELHLAFPNLPTWTWVEKLRETILRGHETTESVDNLISAAIACGHSEGVAEGAEQAKPKIAESTEKLIDWILAMEPPYESANPQWSRKVLLDLVATAAEQERERIRRLAMPVDNFLHQMSLIIPLSAFNDPSVLAPTKEVAG